MTKYVVFGALEPTGLATSTGAVLDFGGDRVILHVEEDNWGVPAGEDTGGAASPRPTSLKKLGGDVFPFAICGITRGWKGQDKAGDAGGRSPVRRKPNDFRETLVYRQYLEINIAAQTGRAVVAWVFQEAPHLAGMPGGCDIVREVAMFLPPCRKQKLYVYPVLNPMALAACGSPRASSSAAATAGGGGHPSASASAYNPIAIHEFESEEVWRSARGLHAAPHHHAPAGAGGDDRSHGSPLPQRRAAIAESPSPRNDPLRASYQNYHALMCAYRDVHDDGSSSLSSSWPSTSTCSGEDELDRECDADIDYAYDEGPPAGAGPSGAAHPALGGQAACAGAPPQHTSQPQLSFRVVPQLPLDTEASAEPAATTAQGRAAGRRQAARSPIAVRPSVSPLRRRSFVSPSPRRVTSRSPLPQCLRRGSGGGPPPTTAPQRRGAQVRPLRQTSRSPRGAPGSRSPRRFDAPSSAANSPLSRRGAGGAASSRVSSRSPRPRFFAGGDAGGGCAGHSPTARDRDDRMVDALDSSTASLRQCSPLWGNPYQCLTAATTPVGSPSPPRDASASAGTPGGVSCGGGSPVAPPHRSATVASDAVAGGGGPAAPVPAAVAVSPRRRASASAPAEDSWGAAGTVVRRGGAARAIATRSRSPRGRSPMKAAAAAAAPAPGAPRSPLRATRTHHRPKSKSPHRSSTRERRCGGDGPTARVLSFDAASLVDAEAAAPPSPPMLPPPPPPPVPEDAGTTAAAGNNRKRSGSQKVQRASTALRRVGGPAGAGRAPMLSTSQGRGGGAAPTAARGGYAAYYATAAEVEQHGDPAISFPLATPAAADHDDSAVSCVELHIAAAAAAASTGRHAQTQARGMAQRSPLRVGASPSAYSTANHGVPARSPKRAGGRGQAGAGPSGLPATNPAAKSPFRLRFPQAAAASSTAAGASAASCRAARRDGGPAAAAGACSARRGARREREPHRDASAWRL